MKRIARWLVGIMTILLVTLPFPGLRPRGSPEHANGPELGDARGLLSAYQTWRNEFQQSGKEALVIPLGWSKGLSSAFSEAHGMATLDLVTGGRSRCRSWPCLRGATGMCGSSITNPARGEV